MISDDARIAMAVIKMRLMNEKPDNTLLSRNRYNAQATIRGTFVLMNMRRLRNKAQDSIEMKQRTMGSEEGVILMKK